MNEGRKEGIEGEEGWREKRGKEEMNRGRKERKARLDFIRG